MQQAHYSTARRLRKVIVFSIVNLDSDHPLLAQIIELTSLINFAHREEG